MLILAKCVRSFNNNRNAFRGSGLLFSSSEWVEGKRRAVDVPAGVRLRGLRFGVCRRLQSQGPAGGSWQRNAGNGREISGQTNSQLLQFEFQQGENA